MYLFKTSPFVLADEIQYNITKKMYSVFLPLNHYILLGIGYLPCSPPGLTF